MNSAARLAIVAKISAPEKERLAKSSCLRFSRYQAEMLMMKNEPSTKAPISVCVSRSMVDGLKTTAQKSAVSARVTGTAVPRHADDLVAGRSLLPAIGDDDPHRGKHRADARP